MSSHTAVQLALGEKLQLVAAIPRAFASMVSYFLRRTLQTWRAFGPRTLKRNFASSFACILGVLSTRQLRFVAPATTGDKVRAHCAASGLSLESVLLTDTDGFPPAALHFIGGLSRDAGPVLLYFHGGGYIAPLKTITLAPRAADAARATLVVLEYTLAPECAYPGQLAQAGAALRHLLQHRNHADIVVAGESAGGNLTLALLTHLQTPRNGITALPAASEDGWGKLRGVVAISPRTKNGTSSPSFAVNKWKDTMGSQSMAAVRKYWKPVDEVWAGPDKADREVWRDLAAQRVLLVAGGDEVYRDDIVHTAQTMGAGNGPESAVQVVVCPGEVHVQCAADLAVGIEDGLMTKAIMNWLERLP